MNDSWESRIGHLERHLFENGYGFFTDPLPDQKLTSIKIISFGPREKVNKAHFGLKGQLRSLSRKLSKPGVISFLSCFDLCFEACVVEHDNPNSSVSVEIPTVNELRHSYLRVGPLR